MKKINNTISIIQKIAKIVSSRDLVKNLEREISKNPYDVVQLDFTNVEFISRSAAHELIILQERMRTKRFKKKEVQFINVSNDLKKMLRIIAANKALPEKSKPKVHLEKTDIQSLMKITSNS